MFKLELKKLYNFRPKILDLRIKDSASKLLILLVLGDIAFILLHVFVSVRLPEGNLYDLSEDYSFAETHMYMKEYWVAILLFLLGITRKKFIYFSWSLMFLILLLDDALQIHERVGGSLSVYFNDKFYLRPQDYGELLVYAIYALVLFSLIGFAYLRTDEQGKKVSKNLFVLIVILAIFGVFIDMLGIMTWNILEYKSLSYWAYISEHLSAVIEDGGEMLVLSIILSYVFGLKMGVRDQKINIFEK
ncbi:hypothetical protein GS597_12465 [Synechococcales cyanobacterium C]|uniref:Uncharacterized protein n=1 Tax=Petrachloros mirabilis ULC683 TaxID=2781853 RepID=A0A8K1ZXV4_9CYAN|nr:hypothetical protein [Petrachloros mirabilis]NCJ07305.1 hypothetical protein [Petrachloros mirabilis ULC683]